MPTAALRSGAGLGRDGRLFRLHRRLRLRFLRLSFLRILRVRRLGLGLGPIRTPGLIGREGGGGGRAAQGGRGFGGARRREAQAAKFVLAFLLFAAGADGGLGGVDANGNGAEERPRAREGGDGRVRVLDRRIRKNG